MISCVNFIQAEFMNLSQKYVSSSAVSNLISF